MKMMMKMKMKMKMMMKMKMKMMMMKMKMKMMNGRLAERKRQTTMDGIEFDIRLTRRIVPSPLFSFFFPFFLGQSN